MKSIIVFGLLLFCGSSLAADLLPFEKTCTELGFKKRTPAYGNCILLLNEKAIQQRNADLEESRLRDSEAIKRELDLAAGDGTMEHTHCYRMGNIHGTAPYGECRKALEAGKVAEQAAAARAAQAVLAAEAERQRNEAAQRYASEQETLRNARLRDCQRMQEYLLREEARRGQAERQQALEYARMTPMERAAHGSYTSGQQFGQALGNLFGGQSEHARQQERFRRDC